MTGSIAGPVVVLVDARPPRVGVEEPTTGRLT
jgi:hypothetical protein